VAKVVSTCFKQRADDRVPAGIDAAEASEPGSPHQFQKECLGLVILRMANGNAIGAQTGSRALQKVVSNAPRGVLHGKSLRSRISADIARLGDERQGMAGCEIATELLVAASGLPQAMIQVSDPGNREPAGLCKVAEEERERNGVRSSRQANKHTAARRAEPVLMDRATDLLVEG
jgi:hypothetical protein